MKHAPRPQIELAITSLGAMGDGIAQYNGKVAFVPLTCPGDVVKAQIKRDTRDEIHADLISVVTPSTQRQSPPCVHFGVCGGCSLQHLSEPTYHAFKQQLIESFIAGMGVDREVIAPMIEIKQHSRRRADFKVEVHQDDIRIGFMARGSHHLINLTECPISDPALLDGLPALKACLATLKKPGRIKSVNMTALEHGLDVTLKLSSALGTVDKEALIAFAKNNAILRLNTQIKTRHESRRVAIVEDPVCLYDVGNATISFAGIDVALPSGAFLQATHEGQMAITHLVTEHLKGCRTIADLYSGCGTYSFPLIQQSQRVSAYEGAAEMAAAMNDACVANGLDDKIETTVRDLFDHPLTAEELNVFDGVVINPPRNGALPQVKAIGQSTVPIVVMVSCDASTFKRDAKQLIESGYTLTLAVPIDQFYWSRHIELVAVFKRK